MKNQEQKVKYAIHKINNQDKEIVKAWIMKELELHTKNEEAKKETTTKNLAIGTVALALANLLIQKPIITSLVIFAGLGTIALETQKHYYVEKEKTFETAIFSYEELREYEKLHPKKEKITNNPELKNVTKRKILKRTAKQRRNIS